MSEILSIEALKEGLAEKHKLQQKIKDTNINAWPEPQDISANINSKAYPIDALPTNIQQAVSEVQAIAQAPTSLIVSTALSAVSTAVQAYADSERASYLQSPSSLYFMAVADSGERKSTCDGYFTKAIREFQRFKKREIKPLLDEFKAHELAWESKTNGIKDKIRELTKTSKDTSGKEAELLIHMQSKPELPKTPNLIIEEFTPEALKWRLAKTWPVGALISSEAGNIFGSHGMSKDSMMQTMSTLNQLWDGVPTSVDRRTSESFEVEGARLSVGLQIQAPTLKAFFDRDKGLSRGIGLLARVLLCWPESTQGKRLFNTEIGSTPALDNFNNKIMRLLNWELPFNEFGILTPTMLKMTPEAREYWIDVYNHFETRLGKSNDLHDIKDVASKAADNVMRVATILQVFESELLQDIELNYIERAARIVDWHMNESLRFFNQIALPPQQDNALKLSEWLIKQCKRDNTYEISRRTVQRNITPSALRNGKLLEEALATLTQADHIRLTETDKHKIIQINPHLLKPESKQGLAEMTLATFAT